MTAADPSSSWSRADVALLDVPTASVVVVTGEADMTAETRLRAALDEAMAAGKPVLVDLCGCTFLDSSGLGALVGGVRAAREAGLAFGVASEPQGAVTAMFRLVLGPIMFATCDSREAGLAALAGADA